MEKVTLSASIGLVNDKRRVDWELLEDVPLEGTPVLELSEFLKDGEDYLNGEILLVRAKEAGGLCGQRHAERLLFMSDQIPESWRAFYLVFPGTVWHGSRSGRRVPYLRWLDGRWDLGWDWLGCVWGQYGRLVRLSPP